MEDKSIIYSLNGPDGRMRYVGYTINSLAYAVSRHKSAAKSGMNSSPLNSWIRQHDVTTLTGQALEQVPKEIANERLAFWREVLEDSGDSLVMTPEQRSKATKEGMTPEVRSKISEALTGKTRRPYNRTKPYPKGVRKPLTQEQKDAISKVHKGKVVSTETRQKISEKALGHQRNLGRTQSVETRLRMSHVKHEHNHVEKDVIKDSCRWCMGEVFDV